MEPSALARKLQIKPDRRMLLLEPPDEYLLALEPLPAGVELVIGEQPGPPEGCDVVQAFVRDRASLASLAPRAIAALRPDGLLWFAYPKRTSGVATDIHRDAGWEPVTEAGWDGVRQIAIDAVWSALRFRPASEIKRTRRREGAPPERGAPPPARSAPPPARRRPARGWPIRE